MLSPLTSPPPCISPAEHVALTSATPSSFTDIPPVVRWSDEDVMISLASDSPHWSGWPARASGTLWVTEAFALQFFAKDFAHEGEQGSLFSTKGRGAGMDITLHRLDAPRPRPGGGWRGETRLLSGGRDGRSGFDVDRESNPLCGDQWEWDVEWGCST
jgi:hypothetical protein